MTPSIDETGIHIQSFDEIFEALVDGYKSIYGNDISVDQDDPDGQRIGIDARARLDMQQLAVAVYNSLDPDFDDGLLRSSKLSGNYLKLASRSQWDLTVTVNKDTTLPRGYTVKDDLGQLWRLSRDVDTFTGVNTVTFVAQEVGAVTGSNGVTIEPITVVLSVTSITADVDAQVGRDEEKITAFRQRRERSLQNPAYSVVGALFSKLAGLDGVTDLSVYENDEPITDVDTGLPPNSVWAIVEGGQVADIVETIVKQKTAGCKSIGAVESTIVENFVRPNGTAFFIPHTMRFDRPTYVDLYIKVTAKPKSLGDIVDDALIKEKLAERVLSISEPVQAGSLYDDALNAGTNFILSDLEISDDAGSTWTDEMLTPELDERFVIDTDNITVTVIT